MSKSAKDQTPKLTQSALLEMGWTKRMIEELLPPPELKPNPMYRSASPMKLWEVEVVETIMESSAYEEAMIKAIARRASAKKAETTKVAKALEQAEDLSNKIAVTVIDMAVLRSRALAAKQDWYNRCGDFDRMVYGADEATVARWMVNYVRHHLTDYEQSLYQIRSQKEWLIHMQAKVVTLEKIALAYPELAEECLRQIERADCEAELRNFRR